MAHKMPWERCIFSALSPLYLAAAFDENNLNGLKPIISSGNQYPPKQIAFHQGDAYHSIHVVKFGAVKTYITGTAGSKRVTRFYLSDEIIGLESIAVRILLSTAATTTDCRLRIISCEKIIRLCQIEPLTYSVSSLALNYSFFQCLSLHSTNAKLATFLMDTSKRSSHTSN